MPLGLDQKVGALVWSPLGWTLEPEQISRLDAASDVMPAYPHHPYRTQDGFARLNPTPV